MEIAGPGFTNFFVREDCWRGRLLDIERLKERFRHARVRRGQEGPGRVRQRKPHGALGTSVMRGGP